MRRKVLVSGFTFAHHSKYGGYDKAGNNPEVTYICDKQVPFGFLSSSHKLKLVNFFFLDIYSRLLLFIKFDVLHYIYTEDQFFFPRLIKSQKKIIGTVHLDPIFVENYHSLGRNKKYLRFIRSFDLIITLSSAMAKLFNERYSVKTKFIPHGFSRPSYTNTGYRDKNRNTLDREKINIFYSGVNYRDKDNLLHAVKNAGSDLCFHVVGQDTNKKKAIPELKKYDNVHIYGRLTDNEYFSLLNDCDYNFLPLTFATANNALMEAQSFGLVSILPNIEGILDYAAPEPLNLFYDSTEDMMSVFDSLQKTGTSQGLIEHARKFEWETIYQKLNEVYDSL